MIQCLNVYCTYGHPKYDDVVVVVVASRARIRELNRHTFGVAVKIENKTKDRTWIYIPLFFHDYGDTEWLSKWRFGNQMEAGDEIIVAFDCDDKFEVMECGFNFLFRDREDENRTTAIEKSHHDFPALQLSSRANYLTKII